MKMSKPILFLKGFKLDREKIRRQFPREGDEPEGSYEMTWYSAILDCIPETAYKYVGCGVKSDGHLNLVVVIEDGCDEEALKKESAEPKDEILAKIAEDVLTPGIWPCSE
jgi:hypothetical protein